MKKGLKYINALLFVGAFGVSFMKLVHIVVINLSLVDFFKAGFGKLKLAEGLEIDYSDVLSEIRPLALTVLVFLIFVLLGALLSAVLPKKAAYITDIIFAVMQAAGITIFYVICSAAMKQIQRNLAFLGQAGTTKMYFYTLAIWLVIYVLIIILSITGLAMKETVPGKSAASVRNKNVHKTGKAGGMAVENDYLAKISRLEMERRQQNSQQSLQQSPQPVPQPVRPVGGEFYGAVVGMSGEYAQKAFPIERNGYAFMSIYGERVIVSGQESGQEVAAVYYDESEYCVEVMETRTVFLKSGQPLGKGRTYYLPRGTEIYVKSRAYAFKLA